jgi:uncharacterized protein (DUF362 family)
MQPVNPFNMTTRRELLIRTGVLAISSLLPELACAGESGAQQAAKATASPVAIGRCEGYGVAQVTERLNTMLQNIGGLKKLVAGKTVAVKCNLTGSPGGNAVGLPACRTYQIHPDVVLALAMLMERAGAKRVTFLEGTYSKQPIQSTLLAAGWDLRALTALKIPVEFEDTRNSGGRHYVLLKVPGGGDLFPAYQLNSSYTDCDVFVSVAKLKNHRTAGVTLTMKNCFGITPTSLYASHNVDENFLGARISVIHAGTEKPAAGVPQELHPHSPRVESYRVPRHIVDLIGIRKVDLAIIDGIETVSRGEGPWFPDLALQQPNLLFAGRNPVSTDAVATACMGYDPLGAAATGPYPGDNHLALAAQRGLGSNDPKRIEVIGPSIKEALHPFLWEPDKRNT